MNHQDRIMAVARAEDTYDLLDHIAWTDTIRPALEKEAKLYAEWLVNDTMGIPIPGGLTREQVAGRCYGINFATSLFEKILAKGESALKDLKAAGVNL